LESDWQNLATGIPLIYEFESKTLNEKSLWNTLKQTGNKNKILQKRRNFMIMRCEKDTIVSDYVHI